MVRARINCRDIGEQRLRLLTNGEWGSWFQRRIASHVSGGGVQWAGGGEGRGRRGAGRSGRSVLVQGHCWAFGTLGESLRYLQLAGYHWCYCSCYETGRTTCAVRSFARWNDLFFCFWPFQRKQQKTERRIGLSVLVSLTTIKLPISIISLF